MNSLDTVVVILVILIIFIGIFIFLIAPILAKPRKELTPLAKEWRDSGRYIKWESTLEENKGFGELNIFTIERGDPRKPAILFIHGYPTSNFDYVDLFKLLSKDYYVCSIDTPGYGLSDKFALGYTYSIEDDAVLIDHYIKNVLKLNSLTLVTHDKGDSVGLALLGIIQKEKNYTIQHHIITNGNIYLPLAQLSGFQRLILNKRMGPFFTKYVNGNLLAKGLNRRTHTVLESEERTAATASILDYQDGGKAQHEIIQYLNQRKKYENKWLDNLKNSGIPTTIIWGVDDKISPVAVADYVWDKYLKNRKLQDAYYRLPNINHYLQNDKPEILCKLIRRAMGETVNFNDIAKEERPIKIEGKGE